MNKLKKIALIALISTAMTGSAVAEDKTSKADNQQQTEQHQGKHGDKHQRKKHEKNNRKHHGKKKRHKRAKKSNMGSVLRYYRHADMNKEQRKKIKKIFKEARKAIKPNRQKMMKMNAKLKTLSQVEIYDSQAVAKVTEAMSAMQKNILEQMSKAKYQAWKVLTPEQQKKLQTRDKKRKAKKKQK